MYGTWSVMCSTSGNSTTNNNGANECKCFRLADDGSDQYYSLANNGSFTTQYSKYGGPYASGILNATYYSVTNLVRYFKAYRFNIAWKSHRYVEFFKNSSYPIFVKSRQWARNQISLVVNEDFKSLF